MKHSVSPKSIPQSCSRLLWKLLFQLENGPSSRNISNATDFTVGIASALNALRNGDKSGFNEIVQKLRLNTTRSMTANSTMSLQTSHDMLLQLHALSDVEAIVNADIQTGMTKAELADTLDHRLDLLGVYISEKQYLLGLRRAAMELS